METQKLETFDIIGIAVRTTNENGQAGKDISALWTKFMTEGIMTKIPHRLNDVVYSIYTDYEKDHTRPYTTILGCKVENLTIVPDGMVAKTIEKATYQKFIAKGNLMDGAVYNEWTKIWETDIDRAFTADFEVYDEHSQDPKDAEVAIFIALN